MGVNTPTHRVEGRICEPFNRICALTRGGGKRYDTNAGEILHRVYWVNEWLSDTFFLDEVVYEVWKGNLHSIELFVFIPSLRFLFISRSRFLDLMILRINSLLVAGCFKISV